MFIMIDFRLQGIDILPDVIGYILFAVGFSTLAINSSHFKKAGNFNILMIIVSIFQIYEKPAQGSGIQINTVGILVGLVSLIVGLVVVYHLFQGIKEIAARQQKMEIFEEAEKRWHHYFILQLAALFAFIFVIFPPLMIVYLITVLVFVLIITYKIMIFMKICGEDL